MGKGMVMPGTDMHIGIVIGIALALFTWVFMRYITGGFRVDMVGKSQRGASYAGVNVRRQIILCMVIVGIAINILVLGLASFLARLIFGLDATTMTLPGFEPFAIPSLSDISIIGPVLFNQDILVYLMYVTVSVAWWVMYRTPCGLSVRSIGEYPRAEDTAGINVINVRYLAVIASCMLAGLGGAYIVLSQVLVFTEQMSAGKGFIALAALNLGCWNPMDALFSALLFGLCDAMQLRLHFSSPDVPSQLFSMVPYMASILALVLLSGKVKPPADIGNIFVRGGK